MRVQTPLQPHMKALPSPSFLGTRSALLQRRHSERSKSAKAPSVINEVLMSPGKLTGLGIGTYTEPRAGYHFSHIPVYSREPVEIQTKLTVNTPGDVHEQEADRAAAQVVRRVEPSRQR